MGYLRLVMSYEQRIHFTTWLKNREVGGRGGVTKRGKGKSIIDPCIIHVAMYRKSVATLIDLRAFHKFILTTPYYESFMFYTRGNILCDLIVHSKLIKSQRDIFPFILDVNLKIRDNYNLMYIFYVMIFCIWNWSVSTQ